MCCSQYAKSCMHEARIVFWVSVIQPRKECSTNLESMLGVISELLHYAMLKKNTLGWHKIAFMDD